MTYQDCLDFLYGSLPMFQRDGSSAFKKDLNNTWALCEALRHPEQKFASIHVAGTNGKGSVCHLLAAVLQAEGYKVGLYTSPHYFDFRERIKINGQYISKQAVVGFVERMKEKIDQIKPSFFEMTVAMAFDYFARQKVDFAVIETGLGGRLDSTNVIQPLISIITNISYDHQSLLGDTLPLIAAEKAGIIKSAVPVVIGERQPETDPVFIQHAREKQTDLYFADDRITVELKGWHEDHFTVDVEVTGEGTLHGLNVGLLGTYQLTNIRTVLASLDVLCSSRNICVSEDALRYGFRMVSLSTRMMGRWQMLRRKPSVIADSGHNLAGLGLAISQLLTMQYDQLKIVFGVSKDKDYGEMLDLLPRGATYYWCAANLPRSLPPDELQLAGLQKELKGEIYPSVAAAVQEAVREAGPEDLIYIGGSSFVVGEAINLTF